MPVMAIRQRSISFRQYVRSRRYSYGRGSKSSWQFIARALGDPQLPDAHCWQELLAYLQQAGDDAEMQKAGRVVWRSYLAHLSVQRKASTDSVPIAPHRSPSCHGATGRNVSGDRQCQLQHAP